MLDLYPMTENNEFMVDSRVYEISFIFDNKLNENTALDKASAIKQSIASLSGSFISEEVPYMRELAYEMIRVVNNVNVRFNEGYFGWIKFEMDADKVKEFEKNLKLDEEIVRYLVVKTVRENTVFTKRAPVIKAEVLARNGEELIGEDILSDDVEGEVLPTSEIAEVEIPLPVEGGEEIKEDVI
jgi:ribosomal protein S6